jgi:hypothetical protein
LVVAGVIWALYKAAKDIFQAGERILSAFASLLGVLVHILPSVVLAGVIALGGVLIHLPVAYIHSRAALNRLPAAPVPRLLPAVQTLHLLPAPRALRRLPAALLHLRPSSRRPSVDSIGSLVSQICTTSASSLGRVKTVLRESQGEQDSVQTAILVD